MISLATKGLLLQIRVLVTSKCLYHVDYVLIRLVHSCNFFGKMIFIVSEPKKC